MIHTRHRSLAAPFSLALTALLLLAGPPLHGQAITSRATSQQTTGGATTRPATKPHAKPGTGPETKPEPQPKPKAETKAETKPWENVEKEPAWVTKPPARGGYTRFVLNSRSNLLHIVKQNADRLAPEGARRHFRDRLLASVGAEAAMTIGENAAQHMQLVRRACSVRRLTRRPVPGNTLANAWQLWEVPAAKLLDGVSKELRAKAAAALAIEVGGESREGR